jgi:Tol biopolymer transport system component
VRTPPVLRRPWVALPLLGMTFLMLGAGAYLVQQLRTSQPGMYDPLGVADAPMCSPEAPAETLVFTSLRPGNLDIYLFDPLEESPLRLTDHGNLDYNPVLSPDGRWVVFTSDRSGSSNLYALDLTAPGHPVPLTTHPAMDDAPALSPDGTRLTFVSTRSGAPDVHIMPFAPGDPEAEAAAVNLTRHPNGDFNPAFSPDGTRIAFSSNRAMFRKWNPLRLVPGTNVVTQIYVMNTDGSGVRRVAAGLGISGSPAWTSDGGSILYYRATDQANSGIYVTPLRGRGTVRLSPDGLVAFTPTAGPGGSVIFAALDGSAPQAGPASLQPAGGRLYRVEADGSGLTELSEAGRTYLAPHYDSGSGRLVAYGDGPVDDVGRMENGAPFTWPGATRMVQLPDRCVRLHPFRSYFPSVSQTSEVVVATQWVHEAGGVPPGPSAIVSAGLDGAGLRSIHPPPDDGFMWSPVVTRDGEWIFFSRGPRFGGPGADVGIWKVRTDGTGRVHLTSDSGANDAFPDVSADGRWVVFRSTRDHELGSPSEGDSEIYFMDANGEQLRRLTHGGGTNTMPAIAPDGERVVYSTTRAGAGWKLWIQSLVDPEDPGHLLEPDRARLGGRDMHPRFSPDGEWVVFTSDRAGFMDEIGLSGMFPQPYGELFAVPANGAGPAVRLTHDKWEDGLPFWGGVLPKPPR